MFKSVARNFTILTGQNVANAVISFAFLAFVARSFGPSSFGEYILVNTYVTVASLLVSAGVKPIAFRELARNRAHPSDLFDDLFSFRLTLGLLGYTLLISLVFLLGHRGDFLIWTAIAGLALLLEPFNDSYEAYYTAHERMGIPSSYSIVGTLIAAAAGTTLLLSGYEILPLLLSNLIAGFFLTLTWSVHFRMTALKFRFRFHLGAWKRLALLVLPFAPIHAANQMNRIIGTVMLGQLSGPIANARAVGLFNPAQAINNTVVKIAMGLRRALIPPIAARLSAGHRITKEIDLGLKIVIVLFCLPLLLGSTFLAPEVIHILYGEQFSDSAKVLVFLGWAGALQIAAFIPESFLFSHPEHRLQNYIPGPTISVLVNVVICVSLIPHFSIYGAAVAAITARFVYFLFATHYCRQRITVPALRFRDHIDTLGVVGLSFGVWALCFEHLPSPWIALGLAGTITVGLIAGFLLYLRGRAGLALS